jgi:DNA-binding GntR family transcriptional regulator
LTIQFIARQSLGQEVYLALRKMIVQEKLLPGEKLKEGHLAARLGVSRTPVRAALQQLERERLVVTRPGYVTLVTTLTTADLEEMYPMIAVLEGLAARLATPRLTNNDLGHLNRLTVAMAEYSRKGKIDKLVSADEEYHNLLYERSGNHRLQRMVRELRAQMERFEYIFFSSPAVARTSVKRHKHFVKVLKKRDPVAAEQTLRRQWDWGPRELRMLIQRGRIGIKPE